MTTLQFTAGQLAAQCSQIPLGIRAENDVTRVELDFSAWAEEFGAGVVQLLIKRSGDASPYPVLLSQSGSTAVWTVSATDLAVRGPLEAEYLYTVGTTVKKSEVLRFYVLRDIGAPGSAPDPYTEWLEQLTGLAADTEAASQAIQDMAVEATTLAPGSAATVTKTVYPDTGAVTLSFGIPEGAQGDPAPAAAVDAWLRENISQETGYVLDRSLSMQNAAAPADMVGDLSELLVSEVVAIPGNNLIESWEKGDISTSGTNAGQEISTGTGSYYRTSAIPVNGSVYIRQITVNAEGTPVLSGWSNTTYGVVCCYSADAYLGTAAPSSNGLVVPLAGTTYIRIAHALATHAEKIRVYANAYVYPSDNADTVAEVFRTASISKEKIEKNQLDFVSTASACILTMADLAPWYIFGNNVCSSIIPFEAGTFCFYATGTNLNTIYVKCFDENYSLIGSNISIAQANFGNPFAIPAGTKFVGIDVYITNTALLSKLTSLSVYRRSSTVFGRDQKKLVVGADNLPALPPLSLTGQSGGGILSMGHGGLSTVYAEDSIESFYALARCGYAGTEVDIQFTKDHVPVCWHNPTLSTLSGGTVNDHIYDYTLSELDSTFDFRTWWDARDCFRPTVARFEEVCILARAYGWYILPDKMQDATSDDWSVLIAMLKKYKLDEKLILSVGYTALRNEFPNAPVCLSAMESIKDDSWMNGLLQNQIPTHIHLVGEDYVVDDDYVAYTSFNWSTVKETGGVSDCAAMNALCARHNVKIIWYTVETPENIYQLVSYCPDTAIALTGLYTIPDGVNEYLGISWSKRKYGLNSDTEV